MAEQNQNPEDAGKFEPWLENILPRRVAIRYLYSRGAGKNAEDICQDVSQKIARHRKKNKHITAGYIWISLRNMANDYCRREKALINKHKRYEQKQKKQKQKDPLRTVFKDLDKSARANKLYDKVVELINNLDLKKRTILKLRNHEIHTFTFSQIADIIGYSESSVRITYHQIERDIKRLICEINPQKL
jgi:RNA polymerase sigma factor (sigma-70 family)